MCKIKQPKFDALRKCFENDGLGHLFREHMPQQQQQQQQLLNVAASENYAMLELELQEEGFFWVPTARWHG